MITPALVTAIAAVSTRAVSVIPEAAPACSGGTAAIVAIVAVL